MLPRQFTEKIRKAQSNPTLLEALDANASRRISARARAVAALPDFPARREHAHSVRMDVISNLEMYLESFINRAVENGFIVHRAKDSAEAVQIVLDIARENHASLIAKSKTMLSEEIELNTAIQAAGMEVVETDLGEYIVQLRGEHPAHIVTPSVHLRRQDVARTFQEKLGVPYNDDILVMTSLARARLRQVFLNARVGVSGVNFGVADTGMLCIITNEGNGRMVTTLPPVHIALMGIERIVPSVDDLALMLSLLPRSSSGVKMTVYASLLNGPRRPGDPDGSQQRHLVLVDNNRRQAIEGPLAEALLCIRCGACLNACPVFREMGGHAYVGKSGKQAPYPGPIGSVLSPALLDQEDYSHLARASSLCGACREVCPVDIDLAKLLLRVRAGQVEHTTKESSRGIPLPIKMGFSFFTWLAASAWRYRLAQKLAGWLGGVLTQGTDFIKLPAVTGWGYSRDFPRPARVTFQQRFARLNTIDRDHAVIPGQILAAVEKGRPDPGPAGLSGIKQPLDLVEDFSKNIIAAGGSLVRCSQTELAEKLARFLREQNIEQVFSWDANQLPTGLLSHLDKVGIQVLHEPAEEIKVGLTGALAATADTATLMITGGPGRPLLASLLPEIHIAILHASNIYPDLAQVLAKPELRQAAAAALITGPSRTSDIEMSLTIGVHGPKEIHVFLVD